MTCISCSLTMKMIKALNSKFDPWNVDFQSFDVHSQLINHLGLVKIHETHNTYMRNPND